MSKKNSPFQRSLMHLAFVASTALAATFLSPVLAEGQDIVPEGGDAAITQSEGDLDTTAIIPNEQEADYANNLYLAYVASPQANVNRHSEAGLEMLSQYATQRSTVHPEGVVGLNIETDDILFFPFLYWPITEDSQPLSAESQEKVQSYIDGGGVIIFDIQSIGAERTQALRRVLGDVNLRALERVDEDHTLARTFYLVADIADNDNDPAIWVEQQDNDNPEHMSSVIISQARWASQWSGNDLQLGTEAHEMSMREGLNMLIYALTGNYKQDPSHNSSVLEKIELQRRNP